MIDEIKLKINPVILNSGVRLFGECCSAGKLKTVHNQSFDDGMQIITCQVINN